MPTYTTPEQRARRIGEVVQTSPEFLRDYGIQEGTDPFDIARTLYARAKEDPGDQTLAGILKSAETALGGSANIGELPSPLVTGAKAFANSALAGAPEWATRKVFGKEWFAPGEQAANWKSTMAGELGGWLVPGTVAMKTLKGATKLPKLLRLVASAISAPGVQGGVDVGMKGRAVANALLGTGWGLGQQTNLQERGMSHGTRAPGDYSLGAYPLEVASAAVGVPTGGILARKALGKGVPYAEKALADKALSIGKSAAAGAGKFGTAGVLGGTAYAMGADPKQTVGGALSDPMTMVAGGLMGTLGAAGGAWQHNRLVKALPPAPIKGTDGPLRPEVAAAVGESAPTPPATQTPPARQGPPPGSPNAQPPAPPESTMPPRVPQSFVSQAMPQVQALAQALKSQGPWARRMGGLKLAVQGGIEGAKAGWATGASGRPGGRTFISSTPEGGVAGVQRVKGFKSPRIPTMVDQLEGDQLTTKQAPYGVDPKSSSHWSTETITGVPVEPIPMEFDELGPIMGANGKWIPASPVRVGDQQLQLVGFTKRSMMGENAEWNPALEELALADPRTGRVTYVPAAEVPDAIQVIMKKLSDEASSNPRFEGLDPVLEAMPTGRGLINKALGIFSPEDIAALEESPEYAPLVTGLRQVSKWGKRAGQQ